MTTEILLRITHSCSTHDIQLLYVYGANPRSDPSSMGESFFFPLYQARKYVLTSWYPRVVNPSAGKGSPEGDANVRQYVRGL
jgi:hypothetical protein